MNFKFIGIIILLLSFHTIVIGETLNFDEPFGTTSWTEDGHPWSWDNSGWDNIRSYNPHTGTGEAETSPGYTSKLSTDANIDIQGIWLSVDDASNFSYLKLKGYNECGKLIYDVSLTPSDYENNYAYVTLNWVNVKSFKVDYNTTNPSDPSITANLSYDDMDYTYINPVDTLNFDEPFGTTSWTEDGHPWSWDNSGWDNIRSYNPHTGTGEAETSPGYTSKLSTDVNIDIHGIWLFVDNASNFSHLNLKGYNESGTLIYDDTLTPSDYESSYAYVTLNWVNVKSFKVDYNTTNPSDPSITANLSYDDMVYSYSSVRTSTDTRTECSPYTWIDGNTYTANNNTATYTISGGAASGCDSIVTLHLTIHAAPDVTTTQTDGIHLSANSVGSTYQWIDCGNGNTPITGETNQDFTPTNNGNYAVIIDNGSCVDTSACISVSTLGLKDLNQNTGIKIFPNPTRNKLTVQSDMNIKSIDIYDLVGNKVLNFNPGAEKTQINIAHLTPAIYLMKIQTKDGKMNTVKLIKK